MKINGLIQLYIIFHDHIFLALDEALDGYTGSLNGFIYTKGECMVIKLLQLTCLFFKNPNFKTGNNNLFTVTFM